MYMLPSKVVHTVIQKSTCVVFQERKYRCYGSQRIPMNDMEWGGLYWSNWAGLSDVTRSMQTQRGLGASKVSAPSVGGSINIVTRTIDQKKGGSISYAMGNDGYNKLLFHVSTGMS